MKRLTKLTLLTATLTFMATGAWAQGSAVNDIAILNSQDTLRPVPGATITVCPPSTAGLPCSSPLTIYSNSGLTIPIGTSMTADSNGNYEYFVNQGLYTETTTAAGYIGRSIQRTVGGGGGGGSSVTGCTTTGGVGIENGTANQLTCNPNYFYNPAGTSQETSTNGADSAQVTLNLASAGHPLAVIGSATGANNAGVQFDAANQLAEFGFGGANFSTAIFAQSQGAGFPLASTGTYRLSKAGSFNWRNNANTLDLGFSLSSLDVVTLNTAFQATSLNTNPALSPACTTGCLTLGETTAAGTPAAGVFYIRADLSTNQPFFSINGLPEAPLVGGTGAPIDLTGQAAAITATNLINSLPRTATYRVCFSADITAVGSVSSTLGGANGFQVIYTSPTDGVTKTTVANAAWSSTANTTGTAVGGCQVVYAQVSTSLQYSFGYTSNTASTMTYEIHVREEDGLN